MNHLVRSDNVVLLAVSLLPKACLVAVFVAATSVGLAPTAIGAPGDNPCKLAISIVCQFAPIAPDLEGDIDLTKQPDGISPILAPETAPPVDVCANGCV